MQVHIHPLVTIYINTLLAWAKCFLATYGVYPGLYDLLDTPRGDFLAAQLHLRDSTLPRPLLHQSRGPPTIRSEYVALQPHLALPPHPTICTSVTRPVRPSTRQSVVRPVRPSSQQPHSLSLTPQVSRTVRASHGQSVRHPCPSVLQTICPPSHHPVHDLSGHPPPPPPPLSVLRNVCQPVQHCPTVCTPSYHVRQTVLHCLTLHPPHQPVCPTIRNDPTICTTHQPVHQTIRNHPIVCTTTPPVHQTIRHRHTVYTTHQSVRQPVHHQPTV